MSTLRAQAGDKITALFLEAGNFMASLGTEQWRFTQGGESTPVPHFELSDSMRRWLIGRLSADGATPVILKVADLSSAVQWQETVRAQLRPNATDAEKAADIATLLERNNVDGWQDALEIERNRSIVAIESMTDSELAAVDWVDAPGGTADAAKTAIDEAKVMADTDRARTIESMTDAETAAVDLLPEEPTPDEPVGGKDEGRETPPKKATVDDRMRAELLANGLDKVMPWTLQQWAGRLGCAKSTAAGTGTWKLILLARAESKANRISECREGE